MSSAQKSCTKRTFRDRYYSSMDYQEYYLIFGPPTPIVKPLDSPTQDIPELCLDSANESNGEYFPYLGHQASSNCETPNKNCLSSSNDALSDDQQKHNPSENNFIHSTNQTINPVKQLQFTPKEKLVRERPRSKSDNSEYLIFSFLEKINQKGKKKVKLE